MKKTTPYTTKTGLQIGSLYGPALPIYHCRDAEAIQRSLLATASPAPAPWLNQRASAMVRLVRHHLQPAPPKKDTAHGH